MGIMKKFLITIAIIFIAVTVLSNHIFISADGIQLYWENGGYWFEF